MIRRTEMRVVVTPGTDNNVEFKVYTSNGKHLRFSYAQPIVDRMFGGLVAAAADLARTTLTLIQSEP